MKINVYAIFLCLLTIQVRAQSVFENLSVGSYQVGFKIIPITDKSRVTKPLYNYLGEKETGSRYHTFHIHLWYPARPNTGKGKMTYGEYAYAESLKSLNDPIAADKKTGMLESQRSYFQGFFGKISDADWKKISEISLLARKDAIPVKEKFPLLTGVLRPLSTSITNELMASNGYVVAMIIGNNSYAGDPQIRYIQEVADMQQAIAFVNQAGMIDEERIGTYGFSGSGFTQVLLAMQDKRIYALADIESAIYGEASWDQLAASNYYDVKNCRFLFCTSTEKNWLRATGILTIFIRKFILTATTCNSIIGDYITGIWLQKAEHLPPFCTFVERRSLSYVLVMNLPINICFIFLM